MGSAKALSLSDHKLRHRGRQYFEPTFVSKIKQKRLKRLTLNTPVPHTYYHTKFGRFAPWGLRIERIDPLRFLTGCRKSRLNQALYHLSLMYYVAVWCSGNALVLINAVALHRARLVLGWLTAFGYR